MEEDEPIEHSMISRAIENAQRDINIAFVNELSLIFDKLGIDTFFIDSNLVMFVTNWTLFP